MSKHEMHVTLPVSAEAALGACRAALAGAGWQLTGQTAGEVVGQEVAAPLSFHAPVMIHMSATASGNSTTLSFKGSNFGLGPIQSGHVKKQVQMLVDATTAAAAHPAPVAPHTPVESTSSGHLVVINGVALTEDQINAAAAMGIRLADGNFWYDAIMGAWGYQGRPTMGFIAPGLALGGPLAADASNGNTGVFINGRQLPLQDVMALQTVAPMVMPGHFRMDAYGNVALENGFPLGNIWTLAQSSGAPREGILSTYDKTGAAVIG